MTNELIRVRSAIAAYKPPVETINLDNLDREDLWAFWREASDEPQQVAERMFPEQRHCRLKVVRLLCRYAACKATAMMCRLEGGIEAAMRNERECDAIYVQLPDFARW